MRWNTLHLLVGVVAASPLEGLVPRAAASTSFCSAVNKIVTAAKAQAPATSFCSSYLQIPVKTATSTKTITNVVAASVTSVTGINTATASQVTVTASTTVTSTSTIFATVSVPIVAGTTTVTETDSVTSTSTALALGGTCTPVGNQKRNAASASKPACLSTYSSGALLSSACSCLSVPTSTATVTTSATVQSTKTATIDSIATVTVTPTTTVTITSTVVPTLTATVSATVSIQATATITITTTVTTATVTSTNFVIQAANGPAAGDFAVVQPGGDSQSGIDDATTDFNAATSGAATLFTLNSACNLVDETGTQIGYLANQDQGVEVEPVYFDVPDIEDAQFITCTLDPNTNALVCATPAGSTSSVCGSVNEWYLGGSVNGGCSSFNLVAIGA